MGINRQRLFNLCDFKIFRTKEDREKIVEYIADRKKHANADMEFKKKMKSVDQLGLEI